MRKYFAISVTDKNTGRRVIQTRSVYKVSSGKVSQQIGAAIRLILSDYGPNTIPCVPLHIDIEPMSNDSLEESDRAQRLLMRS